MNRDGKGGEYGLTRRDSIGVVAIFGASNFPFAFSVLGGELGSVNSVVVLESALSDPQAFASAYVDSLLLGKEAPTVGFFSSPEIHFSTVKDVEASPAALNIECFGSTGVAVTAGQNHGGPYPASTSPLHTSVGTSAITRFLRPVSFQSFSEELLS